MVLIRRPPWLVIVFCVLHLHGHKSRASNLETRKYIRIKPGRSGKPVHFGTTLALQRSGGSTILYAGAPSFQASGNNNAKNGCVYECPLNPAPNDKNEQNCSSRIQFENDGAMGLSMELDTTGTNLLVCGNQYTYACGQGGDKTLNMIGSCYGFDLIQKRPEFLATPCPTECPKARLIADIVFALDESGSVSSPDFTLQLDWVIKLLSSFRSDIDSGDVQVGIVVFNSRSRTPIDLSKHTFNALQDDISRLRQIGGGTNIVSAIETCRTVLDGSPRQNVAQEMIVLTDGDSSGNILGAAEDARLNGITTVAVGVGSNTNNVTLSSIAGDPNRVFRATDFSNLGKVTDGLRSIIRESAVTVLEGQSTNTSNDLTQCQEGSSAHISAEKRLYVGALGAYDRSGAIVEYKRDSNRRYSSEFDAFTNEDDLKRFIYPTNFSEFKESYFGYSVTTGKFINSVTELVASGAPRYKSKGGVLVYSMREEFDPSLVSYILHPTIGEFWQLGAYFGYSVLSVDIDKDLLDDLLVSAPLFSDRASSYDNGRVFIFTNNQTNPGVKGWMTQGYQPKVLKGSNAIGSRFGMSMVVAGDLDRNGYNDIIIGAPNEENSQTESGAVYIYFLTSNGITESNKQRVLGKNVVNGLRGFGAGILRGTEHDNDLDGNQYPDIVISAPYTDDVLVLYSRPIVSVTTDITTRPASIDIVQCALQPNQTCTTFKFCINATQRASASQNTFDMDFLIELDPLVLDNANKRLFFLGETASTKSFSSLVNSSVRCTTYDVMLNVDAIHSISSDDRAYTPLRVQIHFDFTQSHHNRTLSAVLDPLTNQIPFSEWFFQTGCSGENDSCLFDLQTETTAKYLSPQISFTSDNMSQPFLLGANPGVLEINVTIANVGLDYALLSRMNVFSGPLVLSKVRGDCASITSSSQGFAQLSFKIHKAVILREYFTAGRKCNFVLSYPLQPLLEHANSTEIIVQGNVYSNAGQKFGFDQNLNNNNFTFSHQVRYLVDLVLTQNANPSNVFYNYSTSERFAQTLNDDILGGSLTDISHSFSIFNSGPHILSASSMTFQWPASLTSSKASPLLYLHKFQCNPPSTCKCNIEGKVNYFNLPSAMKSQTNLSLVFPPPSSVNLSRQTTCNEVYCDAITCGLNNLLPFSSATVVAEFKLWLPTLSQPHLSTTMSSLLQVHTSRSLLSGTKFQYDSSASTTVGTFVAFVSIEQNKISIWVIIGSILGGILLIAIVVAALWKGGFFSSKYAEMTKAAQSEAEGGSSAPESNPTPQAGLENPTLEN